MRGNLDYFALLGETAEAGHASRHKTLRLALLADCSTQHLVPLLNTLFQRAGRKIEVYESSFDGIELEARNPNSQMYAFHPDAIVILNSVQMLRDKYYQRSSSVSSFRDQVVNRITSVWERIHAGCKATVIQSTFPAPMERWLGNYELKCADSLSAVVAGLNAAIVTQATNQSGVLLLDVEAIASWVGRKAWFDERLWAIAKSPCALEHLPLVAQNIVDVVLATQGVSVKCVVVDLDNTLWGGVVGDDGPHGIKIGSHGDGEPFYRLQCFLKELKHRGILLAVCSKNDHVNAVKPFQENPEMILKLEDFVAFVANWNNKAENIRNIRDALNIGFDSMLFLDDNSFERGSVRELLPDVLVPELPEDPADWTTLLAELNLFETYSVSNEDMRRSDLYREEIARKQAASAAPSFEAFLESLDMTIQIGPFTAAQLNRIVQLLQRSNQFNLTTRRHNHAQCEAMMRDPDQFLTLAVSLKDRFGDHGLVSVVIGHVDAKAGTLVLTDWLMSCRVLGRGVEEFVMNYVVDHAAQMQIAVITGIYMPTPKNAMVKEFYSRFGFVKAIEYEDGKTEWILSVSSYVPKKVLIREQEAPHTTQHDPRRIEHQWTAPSQTD